MLTQFVAVNVIPTEQSDKESPKQHMRFAFRDVVYARCKTSKKSSCLTRAITTFSHSFDMTYKCKVSQCYFVAKKMFTSSRSEHFLCCILLYRYLNASRLCCS